MGTYTTNRFKARPSGSGSKKHGDMPAGHDVPAAVDEEDYRPLFTQGRHDCPALHRQGKHSRLGRKS